jgi:hypothetical protein
MTRDIKPFAAKLPKDVTKESRIESRIAVLEPADQKALKTDQATKLVDRESQSN